MAVKKHIVAGSGGFMSRDGYHLQFGPIVRYALDLTGKERPKFAYIGTAVGDDPKRITNFYHACSSETVQASHLELFPLPNHKNIEEYLLSQDIIWVAGGDKILRQAWEQGIVLAGVSAGAICWTIGGTTDSFGVGMSPLTDALGLLPYSCGVHYDSEKRRRPLLHKLIAEQKLPDGYATDDGVNIHFIGTTFEKAISDKPKKNAYHVYRAQDGRVKEDIIRPILLSDTRRSSP
jgi:peptidase E